MKPTLSEDLTSLFAIAASGAVTAGITAVLLLQEPAQGATLVARRLETVPAVIAARDLPVGTTLTAADVKVVDWPRSAAPPTDFAWIPEQVIGLTVARPLMRNELIQGRMLLVPQGRREAGLLRRSPR